MHSIRRSVGTKAAHALLSGRQCPPGESVVLRLRLSDQENALPIRLADVDAVDRRSAAQEADAFYAATPSAKAQPKNETQVQRQALAGTALDQAELPVRRREWLDGDCPDWPPPDIAQTASATGTGDISTRCAS